MESPTAGAQRWRWPASFPNRTLRIFGKQRSEDSQARARLNGGMSLIAVNSSAIRAVGDGGHTLAVPFITPPLHHSITPMTHRRTGKIARLSHEDREEVCRRLRDNRPAREIIAWAATRGVVLRAWNVSRWALQREKYRDACQAARAEVEPRLDPRRPLTDEERLAIVDKVDEIMGLKR